MIHPKNPDILLRSIKVLDTQGNEIMASTEQFLTTSHLAPAVYILQVDDDQGTTYHIY